MFEHNQSPCRERQRKLVETVREFIDQHGVPPSKGDLEGLAGCWALPNNQPARSNYPLRIVTLDDDYWVQSHCRYHWTTVEAFTSPRLRPDDADNIDWVRWEDGPPPEVIG